ncbi:hypothetical protein ACJMK2_012189 [Sinanodonta woodiana]|uniref:Rab GTPase-binding effector protein 1 n=1 Tax=Sinanodonta woodiana TaxID=1069815 RepID=A0ABD3V7D7_SINWO
MTDLDASEIILSLKERITAQEEKTKELLQEKEKNEAEFGQKRAMFKELFLQKESDLEKERECRKLAEEKASSLEAELKGVRAEFDDIKAAIAVSEANKEEEIEKIRQQFQQEVASMQSLMKEVAEEASRSTAVQYQNERAKLQELTQKYEEEIQALRSKLSEERESFLSSVAKSFRIVGGGSPTPNSKDEQETLEDSMRKAQHDSEILRAVVLPLEEEILALKEKLRNALEKNTSSEAKPMQMPAVEAASQPSTENSPSKTVSLPAIDDLKDPEEKLHLLMRYLKNEKSARKDLEMYVAVLNTQKIVLEEETDKVKTELKEVCEILEEEKKNYEALKQTWEMANDQFLQSQRLMIMDLRRMENVLTAEQQRQIAELQKKDHEREAQEKKVQKLEEVRRQQEKEQESLKAEEALRKADESAMKIKKKEAKLQAKLFKGKSESKGSLNSVASEDLGNFDDSMGDISLKKSASSSEISRLDDDDFPDSSLHETRSLNEVDSSFSSIRISPEKVINLPLLSEAQLKAITDPTPEVEARKHLLDIVKKPRPDRMTLDGKRLVSDKEWELLQEELKSAHEKLGRPCDMCNNYETQLQSVQNTLVEEQTKKRSLERQLLSEKQITESQRKYIEELENSLKNTAEDAHKEISNLSSRIHECEKYIFELKQQNTQTQIDFNDQLAQFTQRRDEVQKELTRLQEENDILVGKHSKFAEQMQNDDINLPDNVEELHLLLLRYREEVIKAKVGQEHTEATLRSQINFLKDQVHGEQQEKTTLEETLSQEISSLLDKLAVQESLKSELDRESSVRIECEAKIRELEQTVKGNTAKSKQLINALQQQLEEQSNARTLLETDNQTLKAKIQSLQSDLENSEAVQRDFVKLSQSLQIQLEKLRQSETEVRWQYEEDVNECNTCKQQFTVTRRKVRESHT